MLFKVILCKLSLTLLNRLITNILFEILKYILYYLINNLKMSCYVLLKFKTIIVNFV